MQWKKGVIEIFCNFWLIWFYWLYTTSIVSNKKSDQAKPFSLWALMVIVEHIDPVCLHQQPGLSLAPFLFWTFMAVFVLDPIVSNWESNGAKSFSLNNIGPGCLHKLIFSSGSVLDIYGSFCPGRCVCLTLVAQFCDWWRQHLTFVISFTNANFVS